MRKTGTASKGLHTLLAVLLMLLMVFGTGRQGRRTERQNSKDR